MNSKSYEERPLTPMSRCIPVGLPAETMQTAAATFAQTEFHDCDELLGDAVFMHAKTYCFAHRFLISRLEVLALQRLTQVLLTNNTSRGPFYSRLADAIHLVYESTPKSTQFDDPAQKLLAQYVALNFISIPTESLETVVSAGGEFMVDVAQKLAQRIATSGRSTESLEEYIDELKTKVNALELEGQKQRSLLEKTEKEIREWESWNRGISGKYIPTLQGVCVTAEQDVIQKQVRFDIPEATEPEECCSEIGLRDEGKSLVTWSRDNVGARLR
ncbi:hypothetical protein TSTA_061280 [Talaromyces stipitatus ATCC 10500]|uniref:BTB domain-containing protein n=1 Tax=Talaromyces stipitatus (strain ATCC 10500 / CBS 375.48 / QM 6759 / NRRL 1006) TaxID=441959 RepID=B8LV16_TALSN|nr:uncharacterized protein TSTA_061280 [Talaromyces stipitatus ATCC 10500]EED22637.1 hypothetical protein TSTA_061280 [Talaromyces stipitatus ATCC 10500]